MGRVLNTKTNGGNFGTKVRKESPVKKVICKDHKKRIKMLLRRISALQDERKSWEARDRELIINYNTEKKRNAELQNDVFNWQRLYHEAIIAQNTIKVKHAETIQNVTSCLKEIKTAYPHLVGLSTALCRNQTKLTNLVNASQTYEPENIFSRAFGDGRQSTNDLSKKSEKRMKHVGPMVKGVLIQKPTIRLERVMLHQPQDQEQTNNDLTPPRVNALTPIVEENDQETDLHMDQVSMRRKRKNRLGTGERWRMRKQQEQLEKERQKERERESQRMAMSESSDSEDQLGPVIRLQRVSGLLLSPNLLEVDRGRSSEGKVTTSRSSDPENLRLMSVEDPKEGCSWMHLPVHSKNSSVKRKESVSSDSDSSDNSGLITVVPDEVRESVLYKNKTFTMNRKSSRGSSSGDGSRDASDASNAPEPDSTNNVEETYSRQSASDSLGVSTDSVSNARADDTEVGWGGAGDGLGSLVVGSRPSQEQRQSHSFYNSTPITSPVLLGKRIRKPKIHIYPGEESGKFAAPESKVKKVKPVSMSSRNKVVNRLSAGRKSIERRSIKTSLETPTSAISSQRSSQGASSGSSTIKKTAERPNKNSAKKSISVESSRASMFSTSTQRLSQDQGVPSQSSTIKRPVGRPKKSSAKKSTSVESSRPSKFSTSTQRLSQDQVSDVSDSGRNSRRNRGPVSYKEPPVNVKMRRPK